MEPFYDHEDMEVYLGVMLGLQRLQTQKWAFKDFDAGMGISLSGNGISPGFMELRIRFNFGVGFNPTKPQPN